MGLAFRIVTPKAAQRAALEKDSGADARSIMDGEPADIKDSTPSVLHAPTPRFCGRKTSGWVPSEPNYNGKYTA
jgi:hypothetical protein